MKTLFAFLSLAVLVAGISVIGGRWYKENKQPAFPPMNEEVEKATPLLAAPKVAPKDIRIMTDISYCESGNKCHKLDMYLPASLSFPTVIFIHGGSWKEGDRHMYGHLGRFFAANGVGAIIPSFRQVPEVTVEGQVKDITTVFTWAQKNADTYGLNSDIFLIGHSSGAHLVALVATKQYVKPAGTVCISGIYNVGFNVWVSGDNAAFKGLDKKQYSPINYVKDGLPPFLVMYASSDYQTLPSQAIAFSKKLKAAKVETDLYVMAKETHIQAIIDMAVPGSSQGNHLLSWMKSHYTVK